MFKRKKEQIPKFADWKPYQVTKWDRAKIRWKVSKYRWSNLKDRRAYQRRLKQKVRATYVNAAIADKMWEHRPPFGKPSNRPQVQEYKELPSITAEEVWENHRRNSA